MLCVVHDAVLGQPLGAVERGRGDMARGREKLVDPDRSCFSQSAAIWKLLSTGGNTKRTTAERGVLPVLGVYNAALHTPP